MNEKVFGFLPIAVIISLALNWSLVARAQLANPRNLVCEQKALKLAVAAENVESPGQVIDQSSNSDTGTNYGVRKTDGNSINWSYLVSLDVGGKFPMIYQVTVQESGPQNCYLVSMGPQTN